MRLLLSQNCSSSLMMYSLSWRKCGRALPFLDLGDAEGETAAHLGRPGPGICMKLSVDSLHEDDGFSLVWPTLTPELCWGTSFAQRLGAHTVGRGTHLLEKAAHRARGWHHGLHPPCSDGLARPHKFQHAPLAVLLRPARGPSGWAEGSMQEHQAPAPRQIPQGWGVFGRLAGGAMQSALPGLKNQFSWPADRRALEDGGGLPKGRGHMGEQELPGQQRPRRLGRGIAFFLGVLPRGTSPGRDDLRWDGRGTQTRCPLRFGADPAGVLQERARDRGKAPRPLHRGHAGGARFPPGPLMGEVANNRGAGGGPLGQGLELARAESTKQPVNFLGAGHDGIAICLVRQVPGAAGPRAEDPLWVRPPAGNCCSRSCGPAAGPRAGGWETVWESNACPLSNRPPGTRRQAALVAPRGAGLSRGQSGAEHGLQQGQSTCMPPWLQGCRSHGDRCRPLRGVRGPWRQGGLGVTPPANGAEGQQAFARHVRWTNPVRRAVAARWSPAQHSVSLASTLDGCAARAVSVRQGAAKPPMPSYHWRETAVLVLYSIGCPFSFMRMPFHGPPLVLAALTRAMRPCSKRAWAIWAQQTSVHRRCDLPPAALTRPACRAQLEAVAGLAGEAIAADLTRKVVHDVQRQPATLCDDTAPCCTSLASGNERATLAQRGHATPKRGDLRPCSRAWRVTREGQLPQLC